MLDSGDVASSSINDDGGAGGVDDAKVETVAADSCFKGPADDRTCRACATLLIVPTKPPLVTVTLFAV